MTYETFRWKNQARYRCPQCEFDTYSVEGVEDHIREVHKAKTEKAPQLPMPLLFDEHGKKISQRKPELKQQEVPSLEDYE